MTSTRGVFAKIDTLYYPIPNDENLLDQLDHYLLVQDNLNQSNLKSEILGATTVFTGIVSCFTLSAPWSCLLPASLYLGPLNCLISESNNWQETANKLAAACIKKIAALKIEPIKKTEIDFSQTRVVEIIRF